MKVKRGFASDNNSGIHPEILNAINEANIGHCIGYGDDPYTEAALQKLSEIFGKNTEVYFVFTGTASNVLGIRSVCSSYNSIICAESSHLNLDECGAPENFSGCKLITLLSDDGKISPRLIEPHLDVFGNEHHSQPKIISITQSTELGTVYTPGEVSELSDFAHKNRMVLHMDGARLCNAAASLNLGLKEITGDAGVDILSFGGTKNGMMIGESVIFFHQELSRDFKYIRKQGMQLASKMRFISVQFTAFLKDDLWLKNAERANKMAALLAHGIENIPGCMVTQKVESNAVFAFIPFPVIDEIRKKYFFYIWDTVKPVARLMTSFDTTEEDIDVFLRTLKNLMLKN